MPTRTAPPPTPHALFAAPEAGERFAAIADPRGPEGFACLRAIADKIGRTRRAGAVSDIPAGATYLAQFAVHDIDFPTREGAGAEGLLDLSLIYGDGPRHDAFCYQAPAQAGAPRNLLRVGRTRPTASSPAWGAARDLPRASCPHLDAWPSESKTEVLIPNALSDSNALLAQVQTLWALMHNALAGILAETLTPHQAFETARRINRGVYRSALRHDVLGTWLMPGLRARYAGPQPRRLGDAPLPSAPAEFVAGVARLGHGMVREIYALNDQAPIMGLRNIIRHTGTGRPQDMPLTEDWLVDFGRFFAVGSSAPQMARALGPHVARPFAAGAASGVVGSTPEESLVLRDLLACTSRGLRSVRSLIDRARRSESGVFDGCFAQDERRWIEAMRAWLGDTGLGAADVARLAADPPLTLFLMIEAEADTGGLNLGALGSVIMGETLTGAMPQAGAPDADLERAREAAFHGPAPGSMAEMIRFLQGHYRFAEGARLHPRDRPHPRRATSEHSGGFDMLDTQTVQKKPIARIEVADYIEMGRLVAQWAGDPSTRPETVAELIEQLDGIAVVPERIRNVSFVQGTLDTLVLRLPVKEMIEESLDLMSDPMGDGGYPLPQFYADHFRPGFGPVMTPLDTLLARVGDYTIAQCR